MHRIGYNDPYHVSQLILLADPRQPLSPLILSHLPEQPRTLRLSLWHGLILGRAADPNLDFVCLEVGRAYGRERFDGEFDDGRTVQDGLGVLEALELFVKLPSARSAVCIAV